MTNKLESAIVFCILDVQVPYNAVIKAYSALEKAGITNRDSIKKTPLFYIKDLLVSTGYRFPNQKASYIKKFGDNTTDLENATREELVKEIGHDVLAAAFGEEAADFAITLYDTAALGAEIYYQSIAGTLTTAGTLRKKITKGSRL